MSCQFTYLTLVYTFCWYWWNCWPSLFKLSLHIGGIVDHHGLNFLFILVELLTISLNFLFIALSDAVSVDIKIRYWKLIDSCTPNLSKFYKIILIFIRLTINIFSTKHIY